MSSKDDKREITEKIAQFADQVIEDGKLDPQPGDRALQGAQQVIVRLHKAGEQAVPQAGMADRIRRNLMHAYNEEQARKKESWINRLFNPGGGGWQTQAGRQRRFVTQMAFIALVILLVAGPLVSAGGDGLQGTAAGGGGWTPLLVLAGLAGIGYFIWRGKK